MSDFTLGDLAALPVPEIIETLSHEAILAARKQKFLDLCIARGIDYATLDLESDPGAILLEESSYEEIVLRARGNDIAREAYLYFASGDALEHLAAFYDVERLAGEKDDRLKVRTILAIQGRSTGGTRARYKGIAMAASLRVADVEVYTVGIDPTIRFAVFAADNNGVADASLLQIVRDAVSADDARMVNDTIVVTSAVVQVVDVVADVWLLPGVSETILSTVAADLPGQWIADGGLGRDLADAWLVSRIMVAGVQRAVITAPVPDIVVAPYTAVRIGAVTLNLRGRDF